MLGSVLCTCADTKMSEAKVMKAAIATVTELLKTHHIEVKTNKDRRLLNLFAEQLWWLQLSDASRKLSNVMKKVTRMWKTHANVIRTDDRFGPLIRDDTELISITDRYDKEMNEFVAKEQITKQQQGGKKKKSKT
jgi:hypothetical protein